MPVTVMMYHKDTGSVEMTTANATEALMHPDEWSREPWPSQDENKVGLKALQPEVGLTAAIASGLPSSNSPPAGTPPYSLPVPTLAERTSFGDSASGMLPADADRVTASQDAHREAAADATGDADTGGDHVAVHKGRGVYSVMKDGEEVETGLTKPDAEAKAAELNGAS